MRLSGLFTVIVFSSLQSFAQGDSWQQNHSSFSPAPKNIILYDPIFWKNELKLTATQQRKIDEINSDFYENIKAAYTKKDSSYPHDIAGLLMSRSELIWGTFHHRQKRKWEKLDSLTSLPEDSGRAQSAF